MKIEEVETILIDLMDPIKYRFLYRCNWGAEAGVKKVGGDNYNAVFGDNLNLIEFVIIKGIQEWDKMTRLKKLVNQGR